LLSVIVPTYNEAGNVTVMLERLGLALADHRYEILVVDDDSSDGTWRVAEALASNDNRIRVIRRTGERGLSSAVLAGMNASAGETLVVIDADLQHDEKKIPELVDAVRRGVDVCLGSREADGGSYGSFRRRRRVVSWVGGVMARMLLGVPVSDPMSGFFAISRARYDLVADQVNPCGFKIMLEFLARGPVPRVAEVGYFFGERMSGSTKLTGSVVMDYIRALLGLMLHRLHRRATAPRRSADTGPSTTSKEASGAG
jgi:dolichol-phosphate mannosyltransferase